MYDLIGMAMLSNILPQRRPGRDARCEDAFYQQFGGTSLLARLLSLASRRRGAG